MYKLTVIVAAYNVENYIEKCLESLVSQTYKNIKILVVNDGSTDGTLKKIKYYEEKYKNVQILNKENGGLSSARNLGLKYSNTEYVTFVDGDDYLDKETYSIVMRKFLKENSDMAIFSYKKIFEDRIEEIKLKKSLYYGSFLRKMLSKSDEASIIVWNKIFKNKIIKENHIYFENKAYFEDTGFIFRYLYFTKTITLINNSFYNYIQREGSITKKINKIIFESKKNTLNIITNFYKEKNEYANYYNEIRDMELRMDIYIYNRTLFSEKEYKFKILWKEILKTKIPIRHRVALVLIKIKLYKRLKERMLK